MKKAKLKVAVLTILVSLQGLADQVGFTASETGDYVPGCGKMAKVLYDYELPHPNFYIEGAAGEYFYNNFDQWTSLMAEVSPGFQVKAGDFRLRAAQGLTYLPYLPGFASLQFGTHASLEMIDRDTKASIAIEYTHYSTGASGANINPGINLIGITLRMGF